jgi:alkylhydroperoxidase family enzyme
VTRLEDQQAPDGVYTQARQQFRASELTQLTLAIVAINGWNRLNVAFHAPAGTYKSPVASKAVQDRRTA